MFSIEIVSTFQAIKFHLKQSYDKHCLTLVVISYGRLISYELTTPVRSSIYFFKELYIVGTH